MAVSFNYLWQWASWILITPILVSPGVPRHSPRQHDELTRSSPLHPKLIGFFFPPSHLLTSFGSQRLSLVGVENVGRPSDSHASDSRDVIWPFCPEWAVSRLCAGSCEQNQTFWPPRATDKCLWTRDYVRFNAIDLKYFPAGHNQTLKETQEGNINVGSSEKKIRLFLQREGKPKRGHDL